LFRPRLHSRSGARIVNAKHVVAGQVIASPQHVHHAAFLVELLDCVLRIGLVAAKLITENPSRKMVVK
jgi:hypothetical protein